MADPIPAPLLAVLIDGDNVSASDAGLIYRTACSLGILALARVYGDFSKPGLQSWRTALARMGWQEHHAPANIKGKNATDIALVIDAMDLLHARRFKRALLVSSDSDFTALATRIRAQGVPVYGMGQRHTPGAFRRACDEFFWLSGPARPPTQPKPARPKRRRSPSAARELLLAAVGQGAPSEAWCNLNVIGKRLRLAEPGFTTRTYRKKRLVDLLRCQRGFQVRRVKKGQFEARLRP